MSSDFFALWSREGEKHSKKRERGTGEAKLWQQDRG